MTTEMNYPQMIAEQRRHESVLDHEIAALRRGVGEMETRAWAAVLAEVDERGKPAFSNAESRKTAAELALMQDPNYQAATSRIREAEYQRAMHRLAVERLRSELRLAILNREEALAERRAAAV